LSFGEGIAIAIAVAVAMRDLVWLSVTLRNDWFDCGIHRFVRGDGKNFGYRELP
jgi:hypothetical protein